MPRYLYDVHGQGRISDRRTTVEGAGDREKRRQGTARVVGTLGTKSAFEAFAARESGRGSFAQVAADSPKTVRFGLSLGRCDDA